MTAPHRDTIHVEDAEVLAHDAFEGRQHILRLAAPRIARLARPATFVFLSCGPGLPMRRPFSIMRSGGEAGWIDVLYRVFGHGTALLAERRPGEHLSTMGPIGRPFRPGPRPRPLLIGGGVGIPPMVFLAEVMKSDPTRQPMLLMGSETPFPFRPRPSQLMVGGMPAGVIAAMPLLEDWGIPSRLASLQGFPGCHEGYVTDLARVWLDSLAPEEREEVEIFACGPQPMLAAAAHLARDFGLPAQVSMEEYMACGVGGCAGCTVKVHTAKGPAMQRVCVDGPVFDAATVVF